MKPRIYGDADVSPDSMELLRREGFDALSCYEIDAGDESDDWHLSYAASENRVVFTFNVKDFRRLAIDYANSGREHAGIIASHKQYSRVERGLLHRALIAVLEERTTEDMQNVMLILPRSKA